MDSSSQIDTVQKFAEVIGDNDHLWSLLVGREVSRFDNHFKYKHSTKEIQGTTFRKEGKVIEIKHLKTSKLLLRVDYGTGYILMYEKNQFIQMFNQISPPLMQENIFDLTLITNLKESRQEKKIPLIPEVLNVKILRILSNLCIGISDTKFEQLMTLFSIDNRFYLGKTPRL